MTDDQVHERRVSSATERPGEAISVSSRPNETLDGYSEERAVGLELTAEEPSRGRGRHFWKRYGGVLRTYGVPLALVIVIGVLSMINHFHGHDWGDDFALYMRQARALVDGNVGEVISQNRFAVDNSGWHTFSPYAYPWGWPLLMAPFYAVFGLDYEPIKAMEVVAFCVFLLAYFAIVRRRAGPVAATVLMLLIGLSPSFVGATDTVLSDIPYLCFVGVTLWWMDRCRLRGILEAGRRPLLVLGLLLAFTFNVRREGVTLLFTLAMLHLAVFAGMAVRARSVGILRQVRWREAMLPYTTFALAVLVFHLVLPTALRPNAPGAGLQNVGARVDYFEDVLAEHIGLKDVGSPMALFGSEKAARTALTAFVVLAAIGLLGRLRQRFEEDIILAAYLCCATFVLLVSPYQEPRYLLTITPLLAYFAYQAVPTMGEADISRRDVRARVVGGVPALALVVLVAHNAADLRRSTEYHLQYSYTVNGPESPDAQEMFAAVKSLTRGDDVILFFRARAMTLYSDRLAIMGANLDQLLPRVDWYVMVKNSTYSQALVSESEAPALGLTKVWENGTWLIWRVAPRSRG